MQMLYNNDDYLIDQWKEYTSEHVEHLAHHPSYKNYLSVDPM